MNNILSTVILADGDIVGVLLFLVFGAIALINWVIKEIGGSSKKNGDSKQRGGNKLEDFIKQVRRSLEHNGPPPQEQPERHRQPTPQQPPAPAPRQQKRQAKPFQPVKSAAAKKRQTVAEKSGVAAGDIKTGTGLELNNPAVLQRAVVLHAIFSPPKALENKLHLWD